MGMLGTRRPNLSREEPGSKALQTQWKEEASGARTKINHKKQLAEALGRRSHNVLMVQMEGICGLR